MRREDIIYPKKHQGLDGDSGVGQASEFPSKLFLLSKHIGTFLIVISLVAFLITYGPILRVEIGYRLSQLFTSSPKGSFADLLDTTFLGSIDSVPDPEFSLIIPKIHAKGKIVKDVDPGNYSQYMEALKIGVAHAKGTRLPGENGTIYLFAHSTDNPVNVVRYNAIFYLLSKLEPGDEIDVYYKGAKYVYIASEKRIVAPSDTSFLNPENKNQKETLILQTCFPPGTTWKRLLILAEKKSEMETIKVDL